MKATVRSVTIASAIRAVIAVALIVLMAMPWLDATGIRDIMRQINKSDVAVDVARTTGISTRSNTDFEYALYDLGELVELVRSVEAVANGVQNVADGVTSSSSSSSSGKTKISDPDSASSYTALFKTITIAIAVVWWIGVGLLVLGILRTLISKKSGLMRMAFLYCLVLAVLWIAAITMIDAQLVENLRTESAALGTVGVSLPKTYFNVTALCYASAVVAGVGFIATFIKRKVKSA